MTVWGILQDFVNTPGFWQNTGFIIATSMFVGAIVDGHLKDWTRWVMILALFVLVEESARATYLSSPLSTSTPLAPIVMSVSILGMYITGMSLGYMSVLFGKKYCHYTKNRRIANGHR